MIEPGCECGNPGAGYFDWSTKVAFFNDFIIFSLKCADCQSSGEPKRTKLNSDKLFWTLQTYPSEGILVYIQETILNVGVSLEHSFGKYGLSKDCFKSGNDFFS